MSMRDYEEAARLIRDHEGDLAFAAQPEQRVAQAERVLGLRFPPTYRRFLLELGAGAVGAEEVYGIINDDFDDHRPPQAVGFTRLLRGEDRIGPGMVVIYGLGNGEYFAVDTDRADPSGEAPVVAFWSGLDTEPRGLEVMAADFGSFFLDRVRAELAADHGG